jgi:protein SCO1/2
MRSLVSALVFLLVTSSAAAQQSDYTPGAAAKFFAGLKLVDQNGRTVDLYNDVMKDHTVAIHSFFASCTGACPVMLQTIKSVQTRLGDRMDREVRLVSITVDPKNDTPAVLKATAKKLDAKKGWLFLTGTQEQVDAALRKVGQYTAVRENHKDLIMAGNDRTGLWKKIYAMAKPSSVGEAIESVVDDKKETAGSR